MVAGSGGFDETGVGAKRVRGPDAVDSFVETCYGLGVGAGDDKEVAVAAGGHGGADALKVLAALDDALVGHMAAALGPDLVFQKTASGAGVDELLDGAVGVEGIAVAGVGIYEHGDLDALADAARLGDDLGLGQQAEVGFAEGGGGDGVARHEAHRTAGALGDAGGEGVEQAGEGEGAVVVEDALDSSHAVKVGSPGKMSTLRTAWRRRWLCAWGGRGCPGGPRRRGPARRGCPLAGASAGCRPRR